MKLKIIIIVLAFCFSLLVGNSSLAQTANSSNMTMRKGVATVMFAGLAGAVIGLSTLSFYGEPQEHIGNIWTGLAAGALVGGAYVVVQSQGQKNTILVQVDF